MTFLIERTSKTLKLLFALGNFAMYFGAMAFLVDGSGWTWVVFLCGAAVVALSRLLIGWNHA